MTSPLCPGSETVGDPGPGSPGRGTCRVCSGDVRVKLVGVLVKHRQPRSSALRVLAPGVPMSSGLDAR
jgi:hypothetical protein